MYFHSTFTRSTTLSHYSLKDLFSLASVLLGIKLQCYKDMGYHHHDTGKKGEDMAVEYLTKQNFTILHRNWRYSRYEIDVIATRDKVLHFIEVKTRTSLTFGFPEESVSKKKIRHILTGARHFQFLNPHWQQVQYNILSITLLRNKPPEFFFIEDVYL